MLWNIKISVYSAYKNKIYNNIYVSKLKKIKKLFDDGKPFEADSANF